MSTQSILPTPEITDKLLVDAEKVPNPTESNIIKLTHGEKYLTSKWYKGSGEIAHQKDGRSFEVTANFTLKSEVKVIE
ncbi:MAG: 3-dehydroquinate synthase, partial [Dolichospermum sp.]